MLIMIQELDRQPDVAAKTHKNVILARGLLLKVLLGGGTSDLLSWTSSHHFCSKKFESVYKPDTISTLNHFFLSAWNFRSAFLYRSSSQSLLCQPFNFSFILVHELLLIFVFENNTGSYYTRYISKIN